MVIELFIFHKEGIMIERAYEGVLFLLFVASVAFFSVVIH